MPATKEPKNQPRQITEISVIGDVVMAESETLVAWITQRIARCVPPIADLRVNMHPDKDTLIEVWIGFDKDEPIYGRLSVAEMEGLRKKDWDGLHEVFFRDYVKPFYR